MKWTRKDYRRELTILPNGNIRTHLDDYKKTSISEGQYINPKNISPTIIAGGGIKIIMIEMTAYDGYNGNFVGDDIIGTVVPQNSRWGLTNGYKIIDKNMAKIYRIRKLTPRECFRLMGVSDSDIDKIKASGVSESQQYKMAGNSIVVQVLEGIFTQMFRLDSDALF